MFWQFFGSGVIHQSSRENRSSRVKNETGTRNDSQDIQNETL